MPFPRIHVVFGHVIQGLDLVKEIEGQRVDLKSRPLNDVTIANCGELVPKSRLKAKGKDKEKGKEKGNVQYA